MNEALQGMDDEELLDHGLTCQVRGNLKEALTAFTELLRRRPKEDAGYHHLGNALIRLGRPEKAIPFLEKGLGINRNSKRLHASLGIARSQIHQWHEAEAAFKRAHELDPSDIDALLGLAWVYAHTERESLAATWLRAATASAPNHGLAHLLLGAAMIKLGHGEEGIKALETALSCFQAIAQVSQDCVEGLFCAGTACLLLGRWQAARDNLEKAAAGLEKKESLAPFLLNYFPLEDLYDSLQAAYLKLGDKDKAAAIKAQRDGKGRKDGDLHPMS